MSKNKISALPPYIGNMNDLKILKLDHNPITFPPRDVWDTDDAGRDAWLENLKRFLRQHSERSNSTQDSESGSRYLPHILTLPFAIASQGVSGML
jgi:hypothetical protein